MPMWSSGEGSMGGAGQQGSIPRHAPGLQRRHKGGAVQKKGKVHSEVACMEKGTRSQELPHRKI